MTIEIKVPEMGESITEATVSDWHFQVGDSLSIGDVLVELETDKVTLEIPVHINGVLKEIKCPSGEDVKIGDILGVITEVKQTSSQQTSLLPENRKEDVVLSESSSQKNKTLPPGASRLIAENNLNAEKIVGSGKREQVTKADVVQYLDRSKPDLGPKVDSVSRSHAVNTEQSERIVPLSRLRQRIAERLVSVQHNAAILTTFNEVDMLQAMEMRKRYKELFQKRYGVSLGFMSIFVKAVIHALKSVPSVNAEIRDDSIVYKNYYDISVAVGGPKGLVVPVVRNANSLSYAEIEMEIARLASKVIAGTIDLKELEGGTFTISNGGIYGSMLSTPILNPPQSAILGMHNIVKRPVVVNDEICIRPIMYVALSYDHRIIDGKEAVTFLMKLKEGVENPERMLLSI